MAPILQAILRLLTSRQVLYADLHLLLYTQDVTKATVVQKQSQRKVMKSCESQPICISTFEPGTLISSNNLKADLI